MLFRSQVLGGGDKHAFLHQAGGVTDLRNIATDGFHFKVVEVGATKDDPGAGGSRQDTQMDRRSAMETDATAFGRISSCSFVEQRVKNVVLS